jgi:argininosuccinate synthase
VPSTKRGEPPFSMDANLLHISYEGNALEDPWQEPDESMFTRSVSPETVSVFWKAEGRGVRKVRL